MVDIRREARRYTNSHPYELVPIRHPKRQANGLRYRLHITEQPDPLIAIVLGDFVHNLRSALDHVVVASSSPQSKRKIAGFPIATEDPWKRDANRRYIVRDTERRKSFLRAIGGLPDDAQALIKRFQPYQMPERASESILAIISSLENADKHRALIAIGSGIENPVYTISAMGQSDERRPLGPNQFLRDGAEVRLSSDKPMPPHSEVDVQFRGSAAVSIKIAYGGRNNPPAEFNLYGTMRTALSTVRFILRKLEPFAIQP